MQLCKLLNISDKEENLNKDIVKKIKILKEFTYS